jgi:hypothetical protein
VRKKAAAYRRPLACEPRDIDVMADDHRRRGPGQRGPEGAALEGSESVVLPEHASAYFSPRSPPTSTSHQTIETEAIRLDPAIDPDNAVTQPLNVDGLQPPPWLGERLHSNSPTVLVPIVRARRRRRRLLAGILAAAIGVLAGVVYGVTRPLSPRQTATSGALPEPLPVPAAVSRTVKPDSDPSPLPTPTPAQQAAPSSLGAETPPTTSAEKSTQPAVHSVPMGHEQAAGRRTHPAASSPSAWLKPEPPKAWFK